MVALRFYATGSFFQTIGDFCGVSTSSAQRIVHRVSCAIAALRKDERVLPVIIATAVLHNIMQQNIEKIRTDPEAYNNAIALVQNINYRDVTNVRHTIVKYFER
ncbi:hypothetical protein X777_02175 [Ooceraea biroi]|uniref:Nuclease HARBI1 n=1 Tax=Ooceraea biroi TaxID=2015173 RepID=A0A026WNW3_OOCBI|nr:hypothetical protein X777_02175 [Ooceraea biroi]